MDNRSKKLLALLILLCTILQSCAVEVRPAVIEGFKGIYLAAENKTYSQVSAYYEQLYRVDQKIIDLDDVVMPALDWIEYEKSMPPAASWGSWVTRVTAEGLRQFENGSYRITALELRREKIGMPDQELTPVIKILDADTEWTKDWEAMYRDLKEEKEGIRRAVKLRYDRRDQALATLKEMAAGAGAWEIRDLGNHIYSVKGPWLGYDGKSTDGYWIFYSDLNLAIPQDRPSAILRSILSLEY